MACLYLYDEGSPVFLCFHAHLASDCMASMRNKGCAAISAKTCSQIPLKASLHCLSHFFLLLPPGAKKLHKNIC